jgi:reactive intermediate/imine deaminase
MFFSPSGHEPDGEWQFQCQPASVCFRSRFENSSRVTCRNAKTLDVSIETFRHRIKAIGCRWAATEGGIAVKFISTESVPAARGHYSQAVVHAGVVYVAGQLPIVPGEPERRLATFDEQARRVIDNVIAILDASGSGAELVLRSTVYIADVSHWPAFNAIYAEKFGAHKPARTVVPVAALHYGYLVEMDAIAAVRGGGAG